MRNECRWLLFAACLAIGSSSSLAQSVSSSHIDQALLRSRVALDAGNLQSAQSLLSEAWESYSNGSADLKNSLDGQDQRATLIRLYVLLARKYEGANNQSQAAEAYWKSVQCFQLDQLKNRSDAADSRAGLIRLTAATALLKQGQNKRAIQCIRPILDRTLPVEEKQLTASAKTVLKIAQNAMSGSQFEIAKEAYTLALASPSEPYHAMGRLGVAWSMLLLKEDHSQVAEALQHFIIDYPDHNDAPMAAKQAVMQWLILDNIDRADQTFALVSQTHGQHVEVWSASAHLASYIASQLGDSNTNHNESLIALTLLQTKTVQWLIEQGSREPDRLEAPEQVIVAIASQALLRSSDLPNSFTSSETAEEALGTLVVAESNEHLDSTNELVIRLTELDQEGQWTKWGLKYLVQQNHRDDADQLASIVLSNLSDGSKDGAPTTFGSRLAVGRWLGSTNRWEVLSLATESLLPADCPAEMTLQSCPDLVAWYRLVAESHMQRGLKEIAYAWWQDLVDVRGDTDFATLFRCAETAASVTDVPEATQRLQTARQASAGSGIQLALLDLLDADLAIRDLRFDQARNDLLKVVRNTNATPDLRGRAQWMVGETHFLQEKYRQAIEAYRLVEGLGPSGDWIAASLVQAGKSYEELGRTREASICYGNLIQRFADSAHATTARHRLASLPSPVSPFGSRDSTAPTMKR